MRPKNDALARLANTWRFPTEIRFGVGRIALMARHLRGGLSDEASNRLGDHDGILEWLAVETSANDLEQFLSKIRMLRDIHQEDTDDCAPLALLRSVADDAERLLGHLDRGLSPVA